MVYLGQLRKECPHRRPRRRHHRLGSQDPLHRLHIHQNREERPAVNFHRLQFPNYQDNEVLTQLLRKRLLMRRGISGVRTFRIFSDTGSYSNLPGQGFMRTSFLEGHVPGEAVYLMYSSARVLHLVPF